MVSGQWSVVSGQSVAVAVGSMSGWAKPRAFEAYRISPFGFRSSRDNNLVSNLPTITISIEGLQSKFSSVAAQFLILSIQTGTCLLFVFISIASVHNHLRKKNTISLIHLRSVPRRPSVFDVFLQSVLWHTVDV